MIEIHPAHEPIEAAVRLPGSKSLTNRAIAVAALADGMSRIGGALFSDDTERMADALATLGFTLQVHPETDEIVVDGRGGEIPSDGAELYCENAGTAVRFLMAMVSLGRGRFVIDGNARMRQRPQQPLVDALCALGVAASSRHNDGCPPIVIESDGCRGGEVTMSGVVSSQYFSALAMAAPAMADGLVIHVADELVSQPYIDMTAAVMRDFGAELAVHDDYRRLVVRSGQRYAARDYQVEPDASTASYFYAAAAVTGGRIKVVGLNRGSSQGDLAFVDILEQMGCTLSSAADGLVVEGPEQLRGVDVDMNAISDTAMTLAAIAPFADSPTTIRNIGHIRRKESDRIAAVATELARLGIDVEEFADGWTIQPGRPRPGAVETYDDHRIAMSFAVLGLRAEGIRIRDPECVGKTFPDFFPRFRALTAPGLA